MSESKVVPVALPVKLEMGQSALADTGDYSAYILIKDANGETIISWYDADADAEEADAKAQFIVDAINAHAPSADQGELIKRLMHRVGDYDDPDLCARGKYYTQSDKMVDRRIIAALQSAEAGRKDVERIIDAAQGAVFQTFKNMEKAISKGSARYSDVFLENILIENMRTAIDAAIAGK